jgi:hypothetical protein
MPFSSIQQQRACFAQYNRDIKNGVVPRWDCYEYMKHGNTRSKSRSKSKSRSRSRRRFTKKQIDKYIAIVQSRGKSKEKGKRSRNSPSPRRSKKLRNKSKEKLMRPSKRISQQRVYIGPNGGRYKIFRGRKVYI